MGWGDTRWGQTGGRRKDGSAHTWQGWQLPATLQVDPVPLHLPPAATPMADSAAAPEQRRGAVAHCAGGDAVVPVRVQPLHSTQCWGGSIEGECSAGRVGLRSSKAGHAPQRKRVPAGKGGAPRHALMGSLRAAAPVAMITASASTTRESVSSRKGGPCWAATWRGRAGQGGGLVSSR